MFNFLYSLRQVILFVLFIFFFIYSLAHFSKILQSALEWTPVVWQDEAYAWKPILKVYEEGLSGFKCRENNPVTCYGSTQVLLDAFVLKKTENWGWKDRKFNKLPGADWFYQVEYPEALRYLRVTRVLWAICGVLLIILFGFVFGLGFIPSLALGLSISTFPGFEWAWQGFKNDYMLIPFIGVFFLLSILSFKFIKSHILFLMALLFGVLSLGVKITLLPILIVFLFISVIGLWFEFKNYKPLIIRLFLSAILVVSLYLYLNPHTLVSSAEASWFYSFFIVTDHTFFSEKAWFEIKNIFLKNSLPVFFSIAIILFLVFFEKQKILKNKWVIIYLFFGSFLVLLFTSIFNRSQFLGYFLIVTWSLFLIIYLLSFLKKEIRSWLIITFLMVHFLCSYFFVGAPWKSLSQIKLPKLSVESILPIDVTLNKILENNYDALILDIMLRPSIEEGRFPKENIIYFDSLSEGPLDLVHKIEERFQETKNPSIVFFGSCYETKNNSQNFLEISPAAILWGNLLDKYCDKKNSLTMLNIYSFENGTRMNEFTYLEGEVFNELLTNVKSNKNNLISNLPQKLSPRMLAGAINGIDYWFSPTVHFNDVKLSGEFKVNTEINEVKVKLSSTCKIENSQLIFSVSSLGKVISDSVSLNIKDKLCKKRPYLCWFHFQNWWMERFPLTVELNNDLKIEPGVLIQLDIELKNLSKPNHCRVSLESIKFNNMNKDSTP